jgi:hypothetical protein
MSDLLPCPFCDGEGHIRPIRDGSQVVCALCLATGPARFNGRPDMATAGFRAGEAWNKRTSGERE